MFQQRRVLQNSIVCSNGFRDIEAYKLALSAANDATSTAANRLFCSLTCGHVAALLILDPLRSSLNLPDPPSIVVGAQIQFRFCTRRLIGCSDYRAKQVRNRQVNKLITERQFS